MSERTLPIKFNGSLQYSMGEYKPSVAPRSNFGAELLGAKLTLGASIPLLNLRHFDGYLDVDLTGSFDSIAYGHQGSHRRQIGGTVGWKQYLSDYFFAQANAGLAFNNNELNDGSGVRPESQNNFSLLTQIKVGGRLCFGKSPFCIEPFFALGAEQALGGKEYTVITKAIGINFQAHADWIDRTEYEELKEAKTAEASKAAAKETDLQIENAILRRENDDLRHQRFTIYIRKGVLDYVFKIPKELADKDTDYTTEPDIHDPSVQDLIKNIVKEYKGSNIAIFLHAFSRKKLNTFERDNQLACYRFLMAVKAVLISNGIEAKRILLEAHLGKDSSGEYAFGSSIHGSNTQSFIEELRGLEKATGQDAVMFELMFESELTAEDMQRQKEYEKGLYVNDEFRDLHEELAQKRQEVTADRRRLKNIDHKLTRTYSPVSSEEKEALLAERAEIIVRLPNLETELENIQKKIDTINKEGIQPKDHHENKHEVQPIESDTSL